LPVLHPIYAIPVDKNEVRIKGLGFIAEVKPALVEVLLAGILELWDALKSNEVGR
jgi:hypothetical protein